jgi:hypothetical protein
LLHLGLCIFIKSHLFCDVLLFFPVFFMFDIYKVSLIRIKHAVGIWYIKSKVILLLLWRLSNPLVDFHTPEPPILSRGAIPYILIVIAIYQIHRGTNHFFFIFVMATNTTDLAINFSPSEIWILNYLFWRLYISFFEIGIREWSQTNHGKATNKYFIFILFFKFYNPKIFLLKSDFYQRKQNRQMLYRSLL